MGLMPHSLFHSLRRYMMDTLNAKDGAYGHAGRFRFNFGALARNDLLFEVGKVDELLGRLRMRLGRAKEEIVDTVEKIERPGSPIYSRYEKLATPGKFLRR